ncbi:uncharacterized protein LOC123273112 [Cotesia glomerata]|uniref:uncharacterized protein LOC123273112 n=1 Tax=Cotesia glomerata TaxID=32391 RepID=UPI001D02F47A|nr:uncharacterized protein LOC123273112 [Cotesia glomerata]
MSLPSFVPYRHDRRLRSGGGVALYVRDDLVSKFVLSSANLEDKHPEYLFIEVCGSSKERIVIGVVYKPPNTGHLDDLEEDLETLVATYRNMIIMGDFNSDLSCSNFNGDQLRRLCVGFNLHIIPYQVTHHLENSDTWIDVCIVNNAAMVLSSEQSAQPFLFDHDLISVTCNYKVEQQRLRSFTYRSWHSIDGNVLARLFDGVNIEDMESQTTVDDTNTWFHQQLRRITDITAPERTIHPRRPPAPWFTSYIRDLQARRDKLYRIFRRNGYAYKEYASVRRLVKQRISEAKKCYFDNQLSSAKNTQAMWNDLRRLGLSSGYSDLNVDVSDIVSRCTGDDNVYFNFSTLDDVTVKKAIMRLTSNSVDPDNFPIKAYKCLISFVLPFVTLLFNNSLNSGVFPNEWKLLRIVPIPKRANAEICADYRPISLTSNLLKALERCVHDQIIKYVTENNFIDEYQIAFREGLNTQTAVIKLCDDIRLAINASKVTVAVFFDLSKAFDSLSCRYLLYADDLVIYLPCYPEQINECVAALNAEIVKILEWCNINYLKLNASKTKAVIFGSRVKVNCNNCKYTDCIRVNDCIIHHDTTIKYLDVLIDSTLIWENQVMSVCNRAMRVLAQLKINNEIFNEKLRIKLVTTLIFPVFDYCCAAYCNITNYSQMRLQRKMNCCVR